MRPASVMVNVDPPLRPVYETLPEHMESPLYAPWTDHPQVLLDGELVDAGLAPLLKALWDRGFKTFASCQGYVGSGRDHRCDDAYIAFDDLDSGWRFMRLGAKFDKGCAVTPNLTLSQGRRSTVRFPPWFASLYLQVVVEE